MNIKKMISLGVKLHQPLTLKKQIVLCNYIAYIVLLFGLVTEYTFFKSGDTLRASIFLSTPLLAVVTIILNILYLTRLARAVIAILYPLSIVIGHIFIKLHLGENIPFLYYIQPGTFLIIITIIPIFLFDPYHEKKLYYFMMVAGFITFLSFDLANNILDIGIEHSDIIWEKYNVFSVTKTIVWIGFSGGVTFLRNINAKHEMLLERNNKSLKVKTEEIQAQNEELIQQQEEILTQREYIEEKNKELVETNKMIEDSVRAAHKLQLAAQPTKVEMQSILKDHFTIFKPRDIVSGDFYWAYQHGENNILIVADCTGHGVPGAFMTLIGAFLLKEIIILKQELDPSAILHQLHNGIFSFLKQENNDDNSGMDLSIIVWQAKGQGWSVAFEAAKASIIQIDQNKNIIEHKGSRSMIGGLSARKRSYETKHLEIPNGDMLYLFSDGYKDQNNFSRKKFSHRKFTELLADISQFNMSQQQSRLENALETHMEGTVQRDDILVMGCRVG